ncbi:putative cell wall protein RHD3 [Rosellinia necatrix]|uniref:Putative cell wall protein RHD3 n=1 Tax=Rosellinia necatrix TaxID=77044 RepID=A0A1W2TWP3_ROSNE|nr:putative cell wall protein RHD3 [Rosellinia necatrix]
MRFQFSILLGLSAASAQIQELTQEGPFALRAKGQAANSSIDGFITWYNIEGVPAPNFISYEPGCAPIVGNSSYEWYFNYTGFQQYRGFEVGFLLADPTANTTTPSPYHGHPLEITYASNTNVGIALAGSGGYLETGFDADNKTFSTSYLDDRAFVPGVPPEFNEDLGYYQWAVCWQVSGEYRQTLSWVTSGKPQNPTCELIDLIRVEF